MHRLLVRQLKRHFGKDFDITALPPAVQAFVENVNETYENNDKERRFLENTIDLNSEELHTAKKKVDQKNRELETVNLSLEDKVSERTAELLREKRNAEAANETKTRFLANMSHELRTPLNAIIGFSQVLQKRPDLQETYRNYINKVHIAGQNMLVLVNTLLDFAKVEDGKIDYLPQRFELAPVFQELHVLFEYQAGEKKLELVFSPLRGDESVYADAQLIKQVLINLISNAIKFSPANGRIEVNYERLERGHRFAVADHGKGIPEEELATLFDPFTQGRAAQELAVRGTGLGLSLSKKIIEEIHGGRITCESEVGKGSTFTVELPESVPSA